MLEFDNEKIYDLTSQATTDANGEGRHHLAAFETHTMVEGRSK